jgi:hypothetical protein
MRKRSSYRPKPALNNNLLYILTGNLLVTTATETITRVKVANHGAMDSLVKGKGTGTDIVALGHMLTTAEALAKHNLGRDWLPELTAARDALNDLTIRSGNFVMRANEIKALNIAIEVHDAQLENCTIKQLEDAIHAAKNAIRHKHEVPMMI